MVTKNAPPPFKEDFLQTIVNVHWEQQDNVAVFADGRGWLWRVTPSGVLQASVGGIAGMYGDNDGFFAYADHATWNPTSKVFIAYVQVDAARPSMTVPQRQAANDAAPTIVVSKDGLNWGYGVSVTGMLAMGLQELDHSVHASPFLIWMGNKKDSPTHTTTYGFWRGLAFIEPFFFYNSMVTVSGNAWSRTGVTLPFIQDWRKTSGDEGPLWIRKTTETVPSVNPNNEFILSSFTVDISRDSGKTWVTKTPGLAVSQDNNCVQDVAAGNGILMACGFNGVSVSYDGGRTWEITPGLPPPIGNQNGGVVYGLAFAAGHFITAINGYGQFGIDSNIYRSKDGHIWTLIGDTVHPESAGAGDVSSRITTAFLPGLK